GQLGRAIEAHAEPFQAFATALGEVAPAGWRQERERAAWALMDRGVPEGIARAHVLQPFLVHGPNVAEVALATGRSFEDVTRAFFLVGEATYLDWLGSRLSEVSTTTRWHRGALQALEEALRLTRRQVAERVLGEGDPRKPVEEALAAFLEQREESMTRLGRFMRGIALEEASDLAALTVAVRQGRGLSGRDLGWRPPRALGPERDEGTRAVLDFERSWWLEGGPKERLIRERLGISSTRYQQLLMRAIDLTEALRYDPMLVCRLRRLRESRRRKRLARRLGLPQ